MRLIWGFSQQFFTLSSMFVASIDLIFAIFLPTMAAILHNGVGFWFSLFFLHQLQRIVWQIGFYNAKYCKIVMIEIRVEFN